MQSTGSGAHNIKLNINNVSSSIWQAERHLVSFIISSDTNSIPLMKVLPITVPGDHNICEATMRPICSWGTSQFVVA